jgi:flagellar hook assembly protein FlgD
MFGGDHPSQVFDYDTLTFTKTGTGLAGFSPPEGAAGQVEARNPDTRHEETPQMAVRPNPFNPRTAISYQLTAYSHVNLRVYDTAGRLVRTLVDGWREAGRHEITFDGSGMASGLYLLKMEAGDYHAVQKLMLLK